MRNALTNNPRRAVFFISLSILILLSFLSLSNMTAFSGEHRYQVQRSSLHSYGSSLACDEEKNVGYALNSTTGQAEAGNRLGTKVVSLDGGFGKNLSTHEGENCPADTSGSTTTIFLPIIVK
ncbi:MAG: hypothetical protein AB8G95_09620 [Anaerolineae bacterium]